MKLNAQAVCIAQKGGLNDKAYSKRVAQLVADPTNEVLQRAVDCRSYVAFQRKHGLAA